MAEAYDRGCKDIAVLESELESLLRRREIIGKYLSTIEGLSMADRVFDMKLWTALVEKAIVGLDGKLEFVLHDGGRFVRGI